MSHRVRRIELDPDWATIAAPARTPSNPRDVEIERIARELNQELRRRALLAAVTFRMAH